MAKRTVKKANRLSSGRFSGKGGIEELPDGRYSVKLPSRGQTVIVRDYTKAQILASTERILAFKN